MLIIVRHGQSEANVEERYAGDWDVNLTSMGEKQAEISTKYVLVKYKVDRVYSSRLKRTHITAEKLADKCGLSVEIEEDLRELWGGKWEKMFFQIFLKDTMRIFQSGVLI